MHSRKFTPTTKFFGTAKAYFVCHIGPIFHICLHWVSVVRGLDIRMFLVRVKKTSKWMCSIESCPAKIFVIVFFFRNSPKFILLENWNVYVIVIRGHLKENCCILSLQHTDIPYFLCCKPSPLVIEKILSLSNPCDCNLLKNLANFQY